MCSVPELHQLRTEFRGVFGAEPELEPRRLAPGGVVFEVHARIRLAVRRIHGQLLAEREPHPNRLAERAGVVVARVRAHRHPGYRRRRRNVRRRPPGEGRPLGDRDVPDRVVPGRVGGNRHPLAGRHRPVQCHRRPGALPACGGRRHAVREPHRRTGARPAVDARGPHAALGVSGVSDARDGEASR